MKLSFVPSIIAIAASALIAFGFYSWCRCEDMRLIVSICGGISLLLTGGAMLAVSIQQTRGTVNMRLTSGLFAFLLFVSNVIFCCITTFSMALYIIVNGLLLLTWSIAIYALARAYKSMA